MNYFLRGITAVPQRFLLVCLFLISLFLTSFSEGTLCAYKTETRPFAGDLVVKTDQLARITSMVGELSKGKKLDEIVL